MKSLKAKARKLMASGLMAAAMLPALTSQPVAAAVSLANPGLDCPTGTGVVDLTLPLDASPRMSTFYVRIDGGGWQQTDWYYSAYTQAWVWNSQNGWIELTNYADWGRMIFLNGSHNVEAWELRYVNGAGQWVNLGSCTTSDFFSGTTLIIQ